MSQITGCRMVALFAQVIDSALEVSGGAPAAAWWLSAGELEACLPGGGAARAS